MSENELLRVNHVDVFHGTFQALWDVSLTVGLREIIALIGANTSGKSTLLDAISGFLHPSSGSIEFEGRTICRMDPFKIVDLGITQVPEGKGIFPELSVLDNLIIGSYPRRVRSLKFKILESVYEHFPILRIRRSQLAKTLSGGEQQMLAIGRGLMSNPRLMLLDEISLGLAPIVIKELYRTLKLIRERNIPILFVEQNVRRSLAEADRAYILETGRVALEGDVADLKEEETVKRAYFGI